MTSAKIKESILEKIHYWVDRYKQNVKDNPGDLRYLSSAQALQGLTAHVESLPNDHEYFLAIEKSLSGGEVLSGFMEELNNSLSRYGLDNAPYNHEQFIRYVSRIY